MKYLDQKNIKTRKYNTLYFVAYNLLIEESRDYQKKGVSHVF